MFIDELNYLFSSSFSSLVLPGGTYFSSYSMAFLSTNTPTYSCLSFPDSGYTQFTPFAPLVGSNNEYTFINDGTSSLVSALYSLEPISFFNYATYTNVN